MNDEHKLWLLEYGTDPNEWLKLKQTIEIGGLVADRLNGGGLSRRPARAHLFDFNAAEFWKSQAKKRGDPGR